MRFTIVYRNLQQTRIWQKSSILLYILLPKHNILRMGSVFEGRLCASPFSPNEKSLLVQSSTIGYTRRWQALRTRQPIGIACRLPCKAPQYINYRLGSLSALSTTGRNKRHACLEHLRPKTLSLKAWKQTNQIGGKRQPGPPPGSSGQWVPQPGPHVQAVISSVPNSHWLAPNISPLPWPIFKDFASRQPALPKYDQLIPYLSCMLGSMTAASTKLLSREVLQ